MSYQHDLSATVFRVAGWLYLFGPCFFPYGHNSLVRGIEAFVFFLLRACGDSCHFVFVQKDGGLRPIASLSRQDVCTTSQLYMTSELHQTILSSSAHHSPHLVSRTSFPPCLFLLVSQVAFFLVRSRSPAVHPQGVAGQGGERRRCPEAVEGTRAGELRGQPRQVRGRLAAVRGRDPLREGLQVLNSAALRLVQPRVATGMPGRRRNVLISVPRVALVLDEKRREKSWFNVCLVTEIGFMTWSWEGKGEGGSCFFM